ncbi:MAG TPA: hypothetical protein VFR18_25565 [Terriglobia bacterium]|nr:hypothetical protein [Terriglobia bacterium]
MAKHHKQEKAKGDVEVDVDALFSLPLTEFIPARNAMAAQLKAGGSADEANRVKALVKPTVSAWVVNQLYWKHRNAFDRLISAGQRFREAQASQLSGNAADMRGAGEQRREALEDLLRLAARLMSDAGHSASPEAIRRISTTLEAMSVYALLPDAPAPGRLTADVDPPGFDTLAALIPATARTSQSPRPSEDMRKLEEARKTEIAAAKLSLREAEHVLKDAQERFRSANSAWEDAKKAVDNATRTVEKATEHLQALLRP